MAEEYRENFINTYTKFVLPILFDYEKKRKRSLFLFLLYECTVVVLWTVLCIYLYKLNIFNDLNFEDVGYCIFGLSMLLIVPFEVIFYIFNSGFKKKLKTDIVSKLIYAFGDMKYGDYTLEPKLEKLIISSKLFNNLPDYSTYSFDDTFTGRHCGIDYEVAEVDIVIQSKNPIRVFKGVLLSFISNKKISAQTNIYPSHYKLKDNTKFYVWLSVVALIILSVILYGITMDKSADLINIILFLICSLIFILTLLYYNKKRYGKSPEEEQKINVVNLEDIDFSKRYVVSSEDQVEARYLVTPSFIERFLALEKVYCAKNIRCAFHDNKILFAIATNKDLFEFGSLFHSLTDTKQIENFYNEMKVIFDIMELFKLDEKTGL